MPLRSVKMKRRTLGFHRRVWCPKWTPLSRSWRMVTTAMMVSSVLRPWARTARPWASAVIAQDLLSRVFPRHRSVRGLVPGCRTPRPPRARCARTVADRRSAGPGGHAKSAGRTGCWGESIGRRRVLARGVHHHGRPRSLGRGPRFLPTARSSTARARSGHSEPSCRRMRAMSSSSAPPPAAPPAPARAPVPSGLPCRAGPAAGARRFGALLLAALLPALVRACPGSAGGARWRGPLSPPRTVVAEFRAPAHRYGPGPRGIDIAVPAEGAEVHAVEAGTVRFSGSVAGRGVVSVLHADGLVSTYEPVHGL